MKALLAALVLVTTHTAGVAAGKVRPLDDFYDPSWGFSKADSLQAQMTQHHIMNSRCVVMTGKSIVGTPGYATYAIPRLLFAAPHKLSKERAIEIYDMVLEEVIRTAGDPRRASPKQWTEACDRYRANVSPLIRDLLRKYMGDE